MGACVFELLLVDGIVSILCNNVIFIQTTLNTASTGSIFC